METKHNAQLFSTWGKVRSMREHFIFHMLKNQTWRTVNCQLEILNLYRGCMHVNGNPLTLSAWLATAVDMHRERWRVMLKKTYLALKELRTGFCVHAYLMFLCTHIPHVPVYTHTSCSCVYMFLCTRIRHIPIYTHTSCSCVHTYLMFLYTHIPHVPIYAHIPHVHADVFSRFPRVVCPVSTIPGPAALDEPTGHDAELCRLINNQ